MVLHKRSLALACSAAWLLLATGLLSFSNARAETDGKPAQANAATLPATLDSMLAKLLAADGGTRPDKIRVIVGDFPCGNAGNEGFSTVSRVLEDEVGAAVTRRRDLELITREKLGELLAEKKLNDLDFLDPQTPAGKVSVKAAEILVRGHYLYAYPGITVKVEGVKLHGATVVAALTEKLSLGLFPNVDVLPEKPSKALVDKVLPQQAAETRTNRESVEEISRKLPNRDIPVELWVPGGRTHFQEGERITFSVRAGLECHIAVFCHQIDGSTVVLFPNTHSNSTRVAKDKIVSIPSEEKDRFYIEITPPFGGDIVQVIACTRKSALTGILKDAKAAEGSLYATLSRGTLARGMQAVGTGDAGAGRDDGLTVPGPTRYGETHVVVNTYPSAMATRGTKAKPGNTNAGGTQVRGVKINVNTEVDIIRATDGSKVNSGMEMSNSTIKNSMIAINSANTPRPIDPIAERMPEINTKMVANNPNIKAGVSDVNVGGVKVKNSYINNSRLNAQNNMKGDPAGASGTKGGTVLSLGGVEIECDNAPFASPPPGFWLVEKFEEKAGWLEKHPTIAALRRDWGALLTDKVKNALQGKAEPATALDRKVSKEEIPALVRQGMEYLCGGTIEALAVTTVDGKTTAELVTTYALNRRQGATVKLVQKERLRTPRPTPPEISVADLEELITATATQIAERVVTGTVQDVMALRDAGSGK